MAHTAASVAHSSELSLKSPSRPRNVRTGLILLEAILSGGQTGVDQAGLRAAHRLGLATGGFAPLGWRTLDGPAPHLGTEYGLVQCGSDDYAHRTARNVFAADATVRIATDFNTTGEICTRRALAKYKRPFLDIYVNSRGEGGVYDPNPLSRCPDKDPFDVLRSWLTHHRVRVLNVAGNSEQSSPGIGAHAEAFLFLALQA